MEKSIANFIHAGKEKLLARIHCYHCQNSWEFDPPLARGEECSKCHRDAKVCLNCEYYDPQAYRECRESQASWVREKDKSNFCSYFSPRGTSVKKEDGEDLKKKLEDLFKK